MFLPESGSGKGSGSVLQKQILDPDP